MALQIRKAERRRAKARIALCGPAGSGKTHSGLLLASGLGEKIVVIDTERGSSEWEQGKPNMPNFDVCIISEPFTAQKYIEAIKMCEAENYDVIIIDSLTHAWAGAGGLLDLQGVVSERTKNSYTAWREVTPLHNQLVDTMLQSPCHIIATMRSKTDYVLELNDKGKQQPKKVGLAPIQREGMDYEFTLVFDVDQSTHTATPSKNRLNIFKGIAEQLTKAHGERLLEYINNGVDAPQAPQKTEHELAVDMIRDLFKELPESKRTLKTMSGVLPISDFGQVQACSLEQLNTGIDRLNELLKESKSNGI